MANMGMPLRTFSEQKIVSQVNLQVNSKSTKTKVKRNGAYFLLVLPMGKGDRKNWEEPTAFSFIRLPRGKYRMMIISKAQTFNP